MASECARYPKRFIALGTVPMNDPSAAAIELERCVKELKMPGVQIGSHVNDWNLDAPEIDPFWSKAEEIGLCSFNSYDHLYTLTIFKLVEEKQGWEVGQARIRYWIVSQYFPHCVLLKREGGVLGSL